MQTNRTEIGDGINLCTVRTDKFKHAVFSVNFISKLNAENAAANTLLVSVLTKSNAKFTDMTSYNRELDRLYAASVDGSSKKLGEVHIASINASSLQNKYIPDGEDVVMETVDFALDTIFCPSLVNGTFDPEIVENEKKNLIDAIKASVNNKDAYAVRRCGEVMCENERYATGVYGTVEEVAKITPEALTERYYQVISSAKLDIYFVGEYDEGAFAEHIKERFEDVKRNLSIEQIITKVKKKTGGEVKEFVERQNITQSKLSMGFRIGRSLADRNFPAIVLLSEIYGGSAASKLFMNVREKLSLCYYCSPVIDAVKGIMIVASAIEAKNKEKAQSEIIAQLDEIKNGNITEDEFNFAKDSVINRYSEIEDDAGSIIAWYLQRGLLGLVDSPEIASLAIKYLTLKQVIEASKEICLDTVYFLTGEEEKEVK